jgi:hypothetical protein
VPAIAKAVQHGISAFYSSPVEVNGLSSVHGAASQQSTVPANHKTCRQQHASTCMQVSNGISNGKHISQNGKRATVFKPPIMHNKRLVADLVGDGFGDAHNSSATCHNAEECVEALSWIDGMKGRCCLL